MIFYWGVVWRVRQDTKRMDGCVRCVHVRNPNPHGSGGGYHRRKYQKTWKFRQKGWERTKKRLFGCISTYFTVISFEADGENEYSNQYPSCLNTLSSHEKEKSHLICCTRWYPGWYKASYTPWYQAFACLRARDYDCLRCQHLMTDLAGGKKKKTTKKKKKKKKEKKNHGFWPCYLHPITSDYSYRERVLDKERKERRGSRALRTRFDGNEYNYAC